MTHKKLTIEEIKQEIGWPVDADYLGYIIYFPETDDYLASYDVNEMFSDRSYSKTPDLSIICRLVV